MVVLDGCELAQEMLQRVRQIISISGGDVLLLRALEPRLALDPIEDPLTEERRWLRHAQAAPRACPI